MTLPDTYVSEDDRVTGRVTVQGHSSFETGELFEIERQSHSMSWVTRVNRAAAQELRDALTAWLMDDSENQP